MKRTLFAVSVLTLLVGGAAARVDDPIKAKFSVSGMN